MKKEIQKQLDLLREVAEKTDMSATMVLNFSGIIESELTSLKDGIKEHSKMENLFTMLTPTVGVILTFNRSEN